MKTNILNSSLALALLANSTCLSIAATFSNSDRVTINDFTNTTPYPSSIKVTGLGRKVTNVTVTLQGFSHTYPSDVDILLAEPSGKSALLMAHVGSSPTAHNLTLTFDDSAVASLPAQGELASGTYKPTQLGPLTADFTSPAPSKPYGSALSAFSDINPNTVWSLYVRDDFPGDTGVITGGWSLAIFTAPELRFVDEPLSQTAEMGSTVAFCVQVEADPPPSYQWFFNGTNALGGGTNALLQLAEVQSLQAGAYSVVVLNDAGALTGSPAMLAVIPPVQRRTVPALSLTGQPGSSLSLESSTTLCPPPIWAALETVTLNNSSQLYFDLSPSLPPQRFYRAWSADLPGAATALDLHMVPAITLTGNLAHSVRVDALNQFGPTDAWVTLATVTLTNTSQLYFDVSAFRQPTRLYHLVAVP